MARESNKSMTGADSINNLLANRATLSAAPPSPVVSLGAIVELDLDLLDDNPCQPRQWMDPERVAELARSIRERGTRQPDQAILVRPAPGGRYWIIAGHRRHAAKVLLRNEAPDEERALWTSIAAVVNADATDEKSAFIALEENIQREDLSPVEEGAAYTRLLEEFPETAPNKKALAQRLGIDEQRVQRMIRLHEAPQFLKDAMLKGALVSEGDDAAKADASEGAKPRRVRRRLEYRAALEFLRLYENLSKQDTKNPLRAEQKAEDRTAHWVSRALEDGWTFRRISDHCTAALASKRTIDASEEGKSIAKPKAKPAYEATGERRVLHLNRYRQLAPLEQQMLRGQVLADLDAQADLASVHMDAAAPLGAPKPAPAPVPKG